MTDPSAPEPTMEEILASIRRIISEDDAPAAAAEPEPEAVAAAPAPEPVAPEPDPVEAAPAPTPFAPEPEAADDDVLELTDRYEEGPSESIGDLEVAPPEPASSSYDSLVGDSAAASAASAFAGLAASFKDLNFASGATVEGMVAEMLRPMLKDWLDANLPRIVQTAVQKEVERIARNAG